MDPFQPRETRSKAHTKSRLEPAFSLNAPSSLCAGSVANMTRKRECIHKPASQGGVVQPLCSTEHAPLYPSMQTLRVKGYGRRREELQGPGF